MLKIPKYQRAYEWNEQRRTTLLNDVKSSDEHFFGSILCIESTQNEDNFHLESGTGYNIYYFDIIDGQQRLATISILYAAILKKLIKLDIEEHLSGGRHPNIVRRLNKLEGYLFSRLFFTEDQNSARMMLSDLNHSDTTYRKLLQVVHGLYLRISNSEDYADIQINEKELFEGKNVNKPLVSAFNEYYRTINEYTIEDIENVINHIDNAIVIKIDANDANAYEIFECLNDRGQDLLPSDLIKNKLFSALCKVQSSHFDLNASSNKWKKFINSLQRTKDYQEFVKWQKTFFRHYYLAFKYKKNIKVEGQNTISEKQIVNVYDKIIKNSMLTEDGRSLVCNRQSCQPEICDDRICNDLNDFFSDLSEKGDIFGKFISPQIPVQQNFNTELEFKIQVKLYELSKINAIPSYVLLLYLFSEYPEDNQLKIEITEFLVKYFIRRHITDNPKVTKIETELVNVIADCESLRDSSGIISSEKVILSIIDRLGYSNKDIFKQKLSENETFVRRIDLARSILFRIENSHYPANEPRIDILNPKISVEHILPQGKSLNDNWVRMISSSNEDITDDIIAQELRDKPVSEQERKNARTIQLEYAYEIGNLTLTGYNSQLSKKPFNKKRDHVDENDSPVGYKNGFKLNTLLSDVPNWTPSKINQRTEVLVEKSIEILKLPREENRTDYTS